MNLLTIHCAYDARSEMEQERRGIVLIADYGTLLRKMRLKRGFTQDDLAERLNISRTNISKMENGKQGIQVEDFFAWVKSTNRSEERRVGKECKERGETRQETREGEGTEGE